MITRRMLLGPGTIVSFWLPARARAARPQRPSPASGAAPLVMLDPGHGGKDPGAIGVSGTYEKHIAFAAAMELRRLLLADGRYRVALTRTRDVFIPLEDRVALAQRQGASLFVSMHADALPDHSVRGASVYTLAPHASDPQSAALATRENAADRYAGRAFRGTSPEVAHILASLVRQETRRDSVRMAHSVVSAFDGQVPLLENPARRANFMVLKAADIASVLVEMGFMSNPQDEAALRRPQHRAQVAAALRRAIDSYFAQAAPPPAPTRVAG
jgi:N-acetylmuramoyl-L-alanine amidase